MTYFVQFCIRGPGILQRFLLQCLNSQSKFYGFFYTGKWTTCESDLGLVVQGGVWQADFNGEGQGTLLDTFLNPSLSVLILFARCSCQVWPLIGFSPFYFLFFVREPLTTELHTEQGHVSYCFFIAFFGQRETDNRAKNSRMNLS